MKHLPIFSLFITTIANSQENKDSLAILKLLENDYKTLGIWDIKSHVENCTENYLLIENGEIWDIKKESEYYKNNANRVLTRKDFFDIKYVRVYGDYAYSVYYLKSEIVENKGIKVLTWVESAIFRKIKDSWKIELINSTTIDLKKY